MNVLIAGGTGLIGSRLAAILVESGHTVHILTRTPSEPNHVAWNPESEELDVSKIGDTEVIINLCGAGIADKNWTKKRKQELLDSRVKPIQFLWEQRTAFPKLQHFVSASGITCYGFAERELPYSETDPFGDGFIDRLVEKWESAADAFSSEVTVTKLRTAIVLSDRGGAVKQFIRPMKFGMGAAIGSGKQIVPWIHIDDLAALFLHIIDKRMDGVYNAVSGNATNKELTQALASRLGKKIWLPPVPGIMIRMLFGQMAEILLKGVKVSNEKIKKTGFEFKYSRLEDAVKALEIR